MNLKKQIAVIVLALTATTSPVWSQDKQALRSPTAQSLQGTWRVTRTAVNCITGQDILSFPAIKTFHQGGTYTGYGVPPGAIPVRGPNTVFGSASQAVRITRIRVVAYSYTAEGDFDGRVEATTSGPSHQRRTASSIAPQSSSSTPMAICSLPWVHSGRLERGLNKRRILT